MDKSSVWKWIIFVGLVVSSIAVVSIFKIHKGLDIAGGASFIIKIDEDKLRENIISKATRESPDKTPPSESQINEDFAETLKEAQDTAPEIIRNRIDTLGIGETSIYAEKQKNRFVVQLPGIDTNQLAEAKDLILRVAYLEFRMVHMYNDRYVRVLADKKKAPKGYVISASESRPVYIRDKTVEPDPPAVLAKFAIDDVVHDAEYEFMLEKREDQGRETFVPYFVKRWPELTGDLLTKAYVNYQSIRGTPEVSLEFNSKGAALFEELTDGYRPGGARNPDPNHSCYLAIVLDGRLNSAPAIKCAIPDGKAVIEGSFTQQEANKLANVLRAGKLPVPVKFEEFRMVDATLGKDAVHSGLTAAVGGCLAIMLIMAVYYLLPGLLADFTLIMNVLLLPIGLLITAAIMSLAAQLFGTATGQSGLSLPVITLPGIAGIALAIGMAVDANVLIFERMREELRAGKGFTASIEAGFERAFSAIFDSNMTSIITAVILFIVGTGPVRGYAVTLTAGLIINLYTAVTLARMCLKHISSRTTNTKVLKMHSLFPPTNIDFMKPWKIPLTISAVIIAVTWGLMVTHGMKDPKSVFGTDFTGGSSLTIHFDNTSQKPDVENIRSALEKNGVKEPAIQYQTTGTGDQYLEVKARDIVDVIDKDQKIGQSERIKNILTESFPQVQFSNAQTEDIGPQIGKESEVKAAWAVVLSLLAMTIYIAVRFEFGFALGAVVALFHDVLMTAGICHMLGFQMSMTLVAALLTIIGYSINDTIVVFDRVREDLRMIQGRSFIDICNLAVNQTLSRTVLTHFMTSISVLALVLFGGGAIKDFSIAMLIGMISGTYSTMYIATPITLLWYGFKTPDLGRAKVIVK